MARMVLLEHGLPSGERHFDWLLERPGVAEGLLLAFRVFSRIDAAQPGAGAGGSHRAERMKDHRRVYLEFEGALSGGRGSVRRVASGEVESLDEREGSVRVRVRWDGVGGSVEWRGEGDGEDRWWFVRDA